MMVAKLPGCNVHATTVIDCRIKTLKRSYQEIAEMRGPSCGGFGWNDDVKCIVAEKELFDNWVRSHPAAKGLLNKLFPYYDELAYVFGKDRAMGTHAETFADVGSNVPPGFEEFPPVDLNDMEFPSMSSHRFNMSQDDIARPSRGTDSRTTSSGSKRRRGGQTLETADVIKDAMALQTDELRLIAEWPRLALEDESRVRREVVRALRAIPELSRLDMAQCNRILMNNLTDMKGFLELSNEEKLDYCTVLIRGAS
ncbi:uncharacterized protein LOC116404989 [Cucumis sativus]|uniref:uncharacterized protein LOC116404989 n=1 Tax=Cucumis sativus TaxID=3659 RepID=UPI0012F4C719|nr:uncharacterized protein LOC116404989 [Cucumis sativus]XP_031744344.1 uncharacterized protein LOC116404989 [Cucumis sativus]